MTARSIQAGAARPRSSSAGSRVSGSGQGRPRSSQAFHHRGVKRLVEWRIGRLVARIREGGWPCTEVLAAGLEVSRETVQRDLRLMRERGMPLAYDARRHGYHFTGAVEGGGALQLTEGELLALFLAGKALDPLLGTRLHKTLAETLGKIAKACPEGVSVRWEDLDGAFSVKAAGVVAADVATFGKLVNAVIGRREVAFDYESLKRRGKERRRVLPYHVGQFSNGWYLFGKDLGRRGEMRQFALQRMGGLKVLRTQFQREAGFDVREFLSSGFGVWSYPAGTERHGVRIRFTGWAARVVAERQWHPTQRIHKTQEDGSEVEFCAELAGLEEITRWVLSHGRHARVLGPPELKRRVQGELKEMIANAEA